MKTANLIAFMLATTFAGCATYRTEPRPARDLNVITNAQLFSNGFRSAYDAVLSLHSNWLNARETSSGARGVLVYFNDVKLGGVETLFSINIETVSYIRRYDALAATARWGPGHGSGVIYISTHPIPWPGRALTLTRT